MTIELTDDQRQSLRKGEPVRLSVPEAGGTVVLLREDQYEALRHLQKDDEDRRLEEAFLQASHSSGTWRTTAEPEALATEGPALAGASSLPSLTLPALTRAQSSDLD